MKIISDLLCLAYINTHAHTRSHIRLMRSVKASDSRHREREGEGCDKIIDLLDDSNNNRLQFGPLNIFGYEFAVPGQSSG